MRFAFLFLFTLSLLAQSDWSILSSISPGRKVKLKLAGQSLSGEFQGADADSITIRIANQSQSHPKANIRRVALRTPKGRALNAAKGAAIGGAIGAVVGFLIPGDFVRGETALLLGANGAAYGAGIGALVPGYTTIYRVP